MPGARHDFICSVLALSGLALIAGSLSCWRIQAAVRAGSEGGTKSVEVQKFVRLPVVLGNPIYWLTESQFAGTKWWKRLLWAGFPLWLIFLVAACSQHPQGFPTAFVISLALLYGLHQLLKLITAVETSRRFSEDRRNGALELLMVSPLKLNELIDGHVRGMWAQLRRPIITLALMNLLFMTVVIAFPRAFDVDEDRPAFCGMILVAILLLILDLRALIWVGMWRAAVAKRHHRAVLMALLVVMSLPWFLVFLGFSGVLDAVLPHLSFVVTTGSWTIVSVAIDLIATRKAREWMKHRFRDAVTSGS
jgi:ABC-type transport system involved in cytochrome c biogenesis permease component